MKGNALAQAVAQACMLESIERRADLAFNHKQTEEEYNLRFEENILLYNYEEIESRRLPGDDLYLPAGIN